MDITPADVKFILSYAGAAVVFWRISSWITRKQVKFEDFASDIKNFMATVTLTLVRIETNHLVHIQEALTGGREYVEVVSQNAPLEEIHDVISTKQA